jgi:glutamyl-tRNA synthetase
MLGKSRDERALLLGFSEPPVIRMLVPAEVPPFTDLIRGEIRTPSPDDQVLLKGNGFPTYHLAIVVDDHDMRVTHVIRDEDCLSSTGKHGINIMTAIRDAVTGNPGHHQPQCRRECLLYIRL